MGKERDIGKHIHCFFQIGRFGYQCPTNFNPADYFVMTLAVVPGREEECRERVKVSMVSVCLFVFREPLYFRSCLVVSLFFYE